MNEILNLKGNFSQKRRSGKPGASKLRENGYVTVKHLKELKDNIIEIQNFWKKEEIAIKPLISVYYREIVAKSNRIKGILDNSMEKNNDSIVGIKFTKDGDKKHIITHCVENKIFDIAINNIEKVINIIQRNFGDMITCNQIKEINAGNFKKIFVEEEKISKTQFVDIVVDAYFVEKFSVEKEIDDLQENSIITLYDTGTETSKIMEQLGINFLDVRIIDKTTILLSPNQYSLLKEKAPYLISMAVSDISLLEKEDISNIQENKIMKIPKPNNEPTIGVIDTMFDENVYFSEWVEFKNMLSKDIELSSKDYEHGTMISSIIVDGANINPNLDDGCGRFKVRHFGVATSGRVSSFSILKLIEEIVESNKDIKVWNLSLGSAMEINQNFISPEAYILDKIQFENDIIFVVAGTNKKLDSNIKKIGAPADSINSLVVNSVTFDKRPTDYSREGLVLSFFQKPDLSYYGGDKNKKIRACSPLGEAMVAGTSFAAPWISRKMSYLIDKLGLSRELAKALIIDSASGWDKLSNAHLIGYGVVPIKIEDIIKTPDDEIKFMINGVSEQFDTYSYNLPVPKDKDKQPFVCKATLCYFPKCSRNQGVDYTNTEMDIHFGRLKQDEKGNIKIKSIDKNKQSDEEKILMYESKARDQYRKWDNVKQIKENIKTEKGNKRRPKQIEENDLWGISIRTKERLNASDGNGLRFGLVITLKEINGVNRIQDFIQQCQFRGWIVNQIDVENRIDIYNKATEEVLFEDM